MHDGKLQGERLSGVLDACLIPGTPSRFGSIDAPLRPGVQLNASAFHLGIADLEAVQSRCPPLPAGRLGSKLVVTFVQPWSSSSLSELRHLASRQSEDEEDAIYLAVGDGLDREQAEKLQNELGLEMTILPDPEGVIRRRFGVRQWPTTMQVDAKGLVTDLSFERRSGAATPKPRQEEEAT